MARGRSRPAGRPTATSEATRARIMAATLETIRREGIVGASARAIARTGKFNQASIYYHFGSIDDAVLASVRQMSGRPSGQLRAAPRPGREPLRPGPGGAPSCTRRTWPAGAIKVLSQVMAGAAGDERFAKELAVVFEPWLDVVRADAAPGARRRGWAPGCRSTTWRSRSAPCSSGWSCWARRRTTAATPTASSPPSRVWPAWATWPSPRCRRSLLPPPAGGSDAVPRRGHGQRLTSPSPTHSPSRSVRVGPPGQARQPAWARARRTSRSWPPVISARTPGLSASSGVSQVISSVSWAGRQKPSTGTTYARLTACWRGSWKPLVSGSGKYSTIVNGAGEGGRRGSASGAEVLGQVAQQRLPDGLAVEDPPADHRPADRAVGHGPQQQADLQHPALLVEADGHGVDVDHRHQAAQALQLVGRQPAACVWCLRSGRRQVVAGRPSGEASVGGPSIVAPRHAPGSACGGQELRSNHWPAVRPPEPA